jgi:phospholipase C
MRVNKFAVAAVALVGVTWTAIPSVSMADPSKSEIPHYQHVVEIMMENTSYATIIGNTNAPQINELANEYGLATNYFGVTHPSEPNYVASIGGSFFGIQDDNQFYCTPLLATTGMTWRGYFQSLPPTPAPGTLVKTGSGANGPYTYKYPSSSVALYASKHNPFVNFVGTQDDVQNMVPDTQLATDLATGRLANYSLVVPDQCHDMHGTGGCTSVPGLIAAGDAYVGATVSEIMSSRTWREGNNAIVITWDEDDFSDSGQLGTGCCGADPGGGHVVTIVITNKGHEHVTDGTAYNHYSLLRTMEDAFGLPHLAHAGDATVPSMAPLFQVSRREGH